MIKIKPRKNNRIKNSLADTIFNGANYIILATIFIVTLYPLIYVVSASVSDPKAVVTGKMILFPIGFELDGYEQTLKYKDIWVGYGNTIFYTVVGTCLNLLFTLPVAYALSRKDLKGRGFMAILFIITMYFGGGLIPGYLNMKEFGLVNNRGAMVLSGLVTAYNMIIARTFFANTIPHELQEAAYLDGCTTFQLFMKVVLPLSAPIIVVMALYYGVDHWNAYMKALIYLGTKRELYPLQVFLREILTLNEFDVDSMIGAGYSMEEIELLRAQSERAERMKYCIIVVSAAPMLAIYPKIQKFFNKGVMLGSVKG